MARIHRIQRIHFARFRSFATREHKFFGALLTLFHVLRRNNWRATIFFYLRIKYVFGENKKILPCFLPRKPIHDVSHQISRHFYRLLRFFHHHHHHHFKWKGVGFYCFKMNVKQNTTGMIMRWNGNENVKLLLVYVSHLIFYLLYINSILLLTTHWLEWCTNKREVYNYIYIDFDHFMYWQSFYQ